MDVRGKKERKETASNYSLTAYWSTKYNHTDDDFWIKWGCLINFDGALKFGSCLWPSATASSCWTRPPRVGSSSRWNRATRGGPSTASSWRPERERENGGEIDMWGKGRGADGRGAVNVKHGRARQSLHWHSRQGQATNTNKYQPLLSFHWSANLFSPLLHLGTNTVGGIFTATILWMKSWQEQRSSPAFPSVLLFARHNNYCCYLISSRVKRNNGWCAKVFFFSLVKDSCHFSSTKQGEEAGVKLSLTSWGQLPIIC